MKLAPPFFIDDRKLTHYLLIFLPEDDKSKYLALAGFTTDNWPVLKEQLLLLGTTGNATHEKANVFGDIYSIVGRLTGPAGRPLMVKTIWMKEIKTGFTKFITLYPPTRYETAAI